MKRKLVKLLIPVVLVLVLAGAEGCYSSVAVSHWQGTGERVIQVRVDPAADQTLYDATASGAWQWSVRSGWVHLPVSRGVCDPGVNCISVMRKPGINGAHTYWGFGAGGHMYGNAAVIHVTTDPWSNAELWNALCHELGHGLGLDHGNTPGPCVDGIPTATDLANIDQAYSHND